MKKIKSIKACIVFLSAINVTSGIPCVKLKNVNVNNKLFLLCKGCVCNLKKTVKFKEFDTYELSELEQRNDIEYLAHNLPKIIYLFAHKNANKLIFGFFVPMNNTAQIFVLDSVRNNAMPNLNNLLNSEREKRLKCGIEEELLPKSDHKFDVKIEINEQKVYKVLEKSLQMYKVILFFNSPN